MTQAPLHWVKQIEQTVIDMQAVPLSGYPPAFPWDELSQKLAALFQFPDLKIVAKGVRALPAEALTQGFGTNPIALELDLTPLEGRLFFLTGKEEVKQLTNLALTSSNTSKGFLSPPFQEGFYGYLCTQATLAINELNAFDNLALKLGKTAPLPQEEALCIDIEIQHPKQTLFARVICPATFHKAFKEYFHEKRGFSLASPLARQAKLSTFITIGQAHVPVSKWQKIHIGDVLLLERCSFDPQTKKGTAFLCLGETPILRLRIKEEHLKIVNYVTYHEEQDSMDPNTPPSDESEEFSSPDIDEAGNTEHMWSAETEKEEALISAEEIPLTLVVEVARLSINLEELLNLSVGNTLDLAVNPQQGVDLTIQGKRVAKGELIKLGEMLGVKILKLAD